MAYKLQYYLVIDPNEYFSILGVLRNTNFTVSNLKSQDSPIMGNPSDVLCSKIVSNDQMNKALDYVNYFQNLKGVKSVLPMSDPLTTWKDLIPISLTTVVTFIVTLNAIYQVTTTPTGVQLATVVGVPTVVTFLSYLLYRLIKN